MSSIPPARSAIACPSCGATMRALELERKPHGALAVDLCPSCRGLWFDSFESLQLTPESTLALLRECAALAGERPSARTGPLACPRCRRTLAATQDVQRTTRFTYWRCPQGHGRFTPFAQFMREKDYLRPLTGAEIAQVRAQIGTIRCSGCGASVDLGRENSCRYCGAHVEVLDPDAIRRAIASATAPVGPRPSAEAAVEALLATERGRRRSSFASGTDRVVDGLSAVLDSLDPG